MLGLDMIQVLIGLVRIYLVIGLACTAIDLRQLGYMNRGIDGDFGDQPELAVRGLTHNLLANAGSGKDGAAPDGLTDFNRGRVTAVGGTGDQDLVACISDILDGEQIPHLPSMPSPRQENQRSGQDSGAAADGGPAAAPDGNSSGAAVRGIAKRAGRASG